MTKGDSMETCARSSTHQVTAVFTQGKLLLAATGTKSDARDHMVFEPHSPFGDPPSFVLRLRPGGSDATSADAIPFQVAMLFAVGPPPDEVIVHSGNGEIRVPVLVAEDVEALGRREPVSLVRMATAPQDKRRRRIPAAFEELLAHRGEDVRTPLVWPIRLGPLFDGRLELAAAAPRRAIGYSEAFDFSEAFLDALRGLPPDLQGGADRLTTVHVTDTGALVGGVDGTRRLFVAILAY